MEDNRPGSQPEINSDYIDKLLSMPREVQEKSVRKAADTPPATDPEPEATGSEPPKPTRRTALLLLAAAGLLILGFLIGSLFGREKTPSTATTPPATTPPAATLPPQFGFLLIHI